MKGSWSFWCRGLLNCDVYIEGKGCIVPSRPKDDACGEDLGARAVLPNLISLTALALHFV